MNRFLILFLILSGLIFAEKEAVQITYSPSLKSLGFSYSTENYRPAQEVPCPVQPEVRYENKEVPALLDWDLDIVVDTSLILSYDADYDEQTGWIWVAVAPATDSLVRLYRSTDNGWHWSHLVSIRHTPRSLYSKVGVVVGRGDSNWVYLFVRHQIQDGDIYLFRFSFDAATWTHHAVSADADTVDGFSVCRDYRLNYGLYCGQANEGRGGNNAKLLRSFDYGKTWDAQIGENIWEGHISMGPTSFLNLTFVIAETRNGVIYQYNRDYGDPTAWSPAIIVSADTFDHYHPKFSQAFTTPDSSATAWIIYSHNYKNTGDYDVDYAVRSQVWGDTWKRNYHLAWSSILDELVPDVKNYKSAGYLYANAAYIAADSGRRDSVNVYCRWANAIGDPTSWSTRQKVNDSAKVAEAGYIGPKVVYSPGAPVLGSGVLYCRSASGGHPYGLYFDAQWITRAISEGRKTSKATFLKISSNPTISQVKMHLTSGVQEIKIYNCAGNLIKTFTNPNRTVLWNGRDEKGEPVSSGIYIINFRTAIGNFSEKIILQR